MRQRGILPGGGLENTEEDTNQCTAREYWRSALSETTRENLAEDSRYFLHQALSTLFLNVLTGAEGVHLISQSGKQYLDFQGNSVQLSPPFTLSRAELTQAVSILDQAFGQIENPLLQEYSHV